MGRKSRKKVKKMLRRMNDEDAERLADYAERLAEGGTEKSTYREGANGVYGVAEAAAAEEDSGPVPSYTDAANQDPPYHG